MYYTTPDDPDTRLTHAEAVVKARFGAEVIEHTEDGEGVPFVADDDDAKKAELADLVAKADADDGAALS